MAKDKDKDEVDHYEVLGLVFSSSEPVSSSQIKKAYRNMAKLCHPDKNKELSAEAAAEKFHVLNTAYEILMDDEKRKEFDQKCSAKMKRKRQMQEMDAEMRKKREDLEARENDAKRRKLSGYLSESDIVANRKQTIRAENLEIQKLLEEEERGRLKPQKSELDMTSNNNNNSSSNNINNNQAILRVNWNRRIQEHGREYSSQDLSTLFSRWGAVANVVVVGKKAVVELENPNVQALDALVKKTATTGPFEVSWKKRPGGTVGGGGKPAKVSKAQHESMEADVLKKMLSSGSLGK